MFSVVALMPRTAFRVIQISAPEISFLQLCSRACVTALGTWPHELTHSIPVRLSFLPTTGNSYTDTCLLLGTFLAPELSTWSPHTQGLALSSWSSTNTYKQSTLLHCWSNLGHCDSDPILPTLTCTYSLCMLVTPHVAKSMPGLCASLQTCLSQLACFAATLQLVHLHRNIMCRHIPAATSGTFSTAIYLLSSHCLFKSGAPWAHSDLTKAQRQEVC